MTLTAAFIVYLTVAAVVLGLLKWISKGIKDRKTLVMPDDQVLPRMIKLRSPMNKKIRRKGNDDRYR